MCDLELDEERFDEYLVGLKLQDLGYMATDEQYRCPRCGWMWWGGMEVEMASAPPYFNDFEGTYDDERRRLYLDACWRSTLDVRVCKVCGSPMELHKVSPAALRQEGGLIGADPMKHELYARLHFYGASARTVYVCEHILFQLKCTSATCKWVREMTL